MPNFGIQIGIGISTSYAAGGIGVGLNPLSLAPLMWLDASDAATLYDATTGGTQVAADGAIARWEDKSGNARHATQATAAARPLKKAAMLNGLPVVRFDGADDALGHALSVAGDHTLFMVARSYQATTDTRVFFTAAAPSTALNAVIREDLPSGNWGTTRDSNKSSGQFLRGAYKVISLAAVGNGGSFSNNGALVSFAGSAMYGGDASDRRSIGGGITGNAEFCNCDIAEILVFPLLSTGDRRAVEQYLNAKWACY